MKKTRLMALLTIITVLASSALIGCDNRSQMEKDADKAYSDVKKSLK